MFDNAVTNTHNATQQAGHTPRPNDVTCPPEPSSSSMLTPNEMTLAAMRSAERKAAGLEYDGSPMFNSADSVMAFLEA